PPSLPRTVAAPTPAGALTGACPGGCSFRESIASSRDVGALDLTPQVTPRMVLLAVLLALAGGLLAGAVGGWRAARLHPAIELRRVGGPPRAPLCPPPRRGVHMFVTYLQRELRQRMRQTLVISLGLALGTGLVITVSAITAGLRNAQDTVLGALYGVG